jgi:hypothetical protein
MRVAVAIHTAGHLDRQHAKVGHQFVRRLKPLDGEEESGEHRGGHFADAGDGVQMVGLPQRAIGQNQLAFQAFLPSGTVAELADLIADEFTDRLPRERSNRGAGSAQEGFDGLVRQIGDSREVIRRCGGQQLRRGRAIGEFEDPSLGDVLDKNREFGKAQSQEMMQLIDQTSAFRRRRSLSWA